MERKLYHYEGPVTSFNKIIDNYWKASTQAYSEPRAKANLMFQYKRKHKMEKTVKIELPERLTIIE